MTARHIAASSGRTDSTTSGSPPTIATSWPASAGFREPETGASTNRPPAARTSAASALEYSGAGVAMLTSVRPLTPSANARVPRPRTVSIAAPSTSMNTTTSHRAKTSAASFATLAPALPRMADFAGERFQTSSGVPALTRFSAIGSPIAPRPMNPTGAERIAVIQLLLDCLAHGAKMLTKSEPRVRGTTGKVIVKARLLAKTRSAAHPARLLALGRSDCLSRGDDGWQMFFLQEDDPVGVCHDEVSAREHVVSDTRGR